MKLKVYKKQCKRCKSQDIKKDGFKRGKQRYKCNTYGHVFQNKSRKPTTKSSHVNPQELGKQYSLGRRYYIDLAAEYDCSVKIIQKVLDSYEFFPLEVTPIEIVLLMC